MTVLDTDVVSELMRARSVRAAEQYAAIATARERAGAPLPGFGALIAAVCRLHRATPATRNLRDFEGTGLDLLDPWAAGPA